MTTIVDEENENSEMFHHCQKSRRRGKIIGGILVMIVGILFLAKEMGLDIPQWIFTWQMFLIILGIYIGIKHTFRNLAWIILIAVGSIFLMREYMPELEFTRFLWPTAIILLGFTIAVRPRRNHTMKWAGRRYAKNCDGSRFTTTNGRSHDQIEVNVIFGGVKKNILSKTFQGGEVNAVFGGAEINMSQADIQGSVELEVNQVFGGTRLIVPANWEVKSELSAVLGSVEDKRPVTSAPNDGSKLLVLKGTAVFGSIEIHNYQ